MVRADRRAPYGVVTCETRQEEAQYGMDATMSPARSLITAGLLVALGILPSVSAGPVAAQVTVVQAPPVEITTDTPEYCQQLLTRIGERIRIATAPVPHEVTDLTTEGRDMCARGHPRGGIMRLRSALMILKNDGSTYQ